MALRFSHLGPAFPPQLVDALLAGDVVFFCGAGISTPQLPTFAQLVKNCFTELDVPMEPAEIQSFSDHRYEEALGSLRRRIVTPDELTRVVTRLLSPTDRVELDHHHTVLRLSRDLANRPIVVTTNFDTLIERAYESTGLGHASTQSFAGQALPLPGTEDFSGIIHLHGRISDPLLTLTQTPLVITSADYGDAYMRSGWASRFLFDLVRCKTIVLIGYSAGDAPVRYFLNVLESDRERFRELRPVYALDGITADEAHSDGEARWRALAVHPILYSDASHPAEGGVPHGILWHDLARLADLIERPASGRQALLTTILSKDYSSVTAFDLDHLRWLFTHSSELLDIAVYIIEDVSWFDFFLENDLLTPDAASWVVSAWLARDFSDKERFLTALLWQRKLPLAFVRNLHRRLQQASNLPAFWFDAWRLLIKAHPQSEPDYVGVLDTITALKRSQILHDDLVKAVRFISPNLTLTDRRSFLSSNRPEGELHRLSDLVMPRLAVRDRHGASQIAATLIDTPHEIFVSAAATFELRRSIGLSIDAGLIDDDYDMNDSGLPSIEEHPQNAYHDGITFIVQLLAALVPKVATRDVSAARDFAMEWRALPGRIGTRLWLHAMRHSSIFSANEAMSAILALSDRDFWATRRETVLTLRDRAREADRAFLDQIEARIINGASRHFDKYDIDEGQADWRGHAQDQAVWLRLTMLQQAGVLSLVGSDAIRLIQQRRTYLDRATEERDFFGTYMTGVRPVKGNPRNLLNAQDDDRLKLALEIVESPDPDTQRGWGAYCQSDPAGAVDTLSNAPFTHANTRLWGDLLYTLSMGNESDQISRVEMVSQIFDVLTSADDSFINEIIDAVTTLYCRTPYRSDMIVKDWWMRLFNIAIQSTKPSTEDADTNFDAVNSAPGRLIHATMENASACRKIGQEIPSYLLEQFVIAVNATGHGGFLCRILLAREAAFVLSIGGEAIRDPLGHALSATDEQGEALREALVSSGSFSPLVARSFNDQILRGVIEMKAGDQVAINAAAKILSPTVNVLLGHQSLEDSGITAADAARALREGTTSLRRGAADCLSQWVMEIEGKPSDNWRTAIEPTFSKVWPKELRFRDHELSRFFAALAARSGDEFPRALERLYPYMSPLMGHSGLHEIEDSSAPDVWPRETLKMLWALCGPASSGNFHEMPQLIKRVMAAEPALEVDRRLQWLQQHRSTYG